MKFILFGWVLLAGVPLAFWRARWWPAHGYNRLYRLVERGLAWLGRRRALAVLTVFLLSLGLNASLTRLLGISPPHIHDEFANLLAADTFAHGRVANPPHPLWPFFESVHVLSQPAYVSKYPPATGLMLAVGQVLTGQPVAGMWLSVALACAALCWALLAWLPPRWACLGGLLAVFHPILLKWGQVYWGGAEALLGGALLVGAVRRLMNGPRAAAAFWLAVGMVVLALSRPFEGLVLTLIMLAVLAAWLVKQRAQLSDQALKRLVVPVAMVMGLFAGWLGFYNGRITGHPLKMPYMVYEEQYAVAPFLVWLKPRPQPQYRHPFIRDHFVDYALQEYQSQRSLGGFLKETAQKLKRLAKSALWNYLLVVPLLTLPWLARRRGQTRCVLGVFAVFILALLQETWMADRYAAPIGVVFLILVLLGFRHLGLWHWRQRPVGRILAVAVLALCLLQSALWVKTRRWEYARRDWDWQRVRMLKELKQAGGQHLVIVRYGPRQSVHNDWVHNGADIDAAPVVWARDMGAEENRKLLDYFRGRKVWLLEAENPWDPAPKDIQKAKLVPYPP